MASLEGPWRVYPANINGRVCPPRSSVASSPAPASSSHLYSGRWPKDYWSSGGGHRVCDRRHE
eukprot:scaffold198328_cov37-Tisochrysis_lutea.AAC.2